MKLKSRIRFDSESEAYAFVAGIEYVDNDHVLAEGPNTELDSEGNDEYAVYVEEFA